MLLLQFKESIEKFPQKEIEDNWYILETKSAHLELKEALQKWVIENFQTEGQQIPLSEKNKQNLKTQSYYHPSKDNSLVNDLKKSTLNLINRHSNFLDADSISLFKSRENFFQDQSKPHLTTNIRGSQESIETPRGEAIETKDFFSRLSLTYIENPNNCLSPQERDRNSRRSVDNEDQIHIIHNLDINNKEKGGSIDQANLIKNVNKVRSGEKKQKSVNLSGSSNNDNVTYSDNLTSLRTDEQSANSRNPNGHKTLSQNLNQLIRKVSGVSNNKDKALSGFANKKYQPKKSKESVLDRNQAESEMRKRVWNNEVGSIEEEAHGPVFNCYRSTEDIDMDIIDTINLKKPKSDKCNEAMIYTSDGTFSLDDDTESHNNKNIKNLKVEDMDLVENDSTRIKLQNEKKIVCDIQGILDKDKLNNIAERFSYNEKGVSPINIIGSSTNNLTSLLSQQEQQEQQQSNPIKQIPDNANNSNNSNPGFFDRFKITGDSSDKKIEIIKTCNSKQYPTLNANNTNNAKPLKNFVRANTIKVDDNKTENYLTDSYKFSGIAPKRKFTPDIGIEANPVCNKEGPLINFFKQRKRISSSGWKFGVGTQSPNLKNNNEPLSSYTNTTNNEPPTSSFSALFKSQDLKLNHSNNQMTSSHTFGTSIQRPMTTTNADKLRDQTLFFTEENEDSQLIENDQYNANLKNDLSMNKDSRNNLCRKSLDVQKSPETRNSGSGMLSLHRSYLSDGGRLPPEEPGICDFVFTVDRVGFLKQWNTKGFCLLKNWGQVHKGVIKAIIINSDGTEIFTGGGDGTLKQFSILEKKLIKNWGRVHSGAITSMKHFSPKNYLFTVSQDCSLKQWDVNKGVLHKTKTNAHKDWILCVTCHPKDGQVFTGGSDQHQKEWNISDNPTTNNSENCDEIKLGYDYGVIHKYSICSMTISSDGEFQFTGGEDNKLKQWKVRDRLLCKDFSGGHSDSIRSLSVTSDGCYLFSGGDDKQMKCWGLKEGGRLVKNFGMVHFNWIRGVTVSKTNEFVFTTSEDRYLKQWAVNSGKLVKDYGMAHNHAITGIATLG